MSDHADGRTTTYSRRRAALLTLGGLASPLFTALSGARTVGDGGAAGAAVRVGVHSASFGSGPDTADSDALDAVIRGMAESGASECAVAAALIEPAFGRTTAADRGALPMMRRQMMRRELRKWRLRTPDAYFTSIGDRFKQAGVAVSAYECGIDATFSTEEISRVFTIAARLGAEMLIVPTTLDVAKRLVPLVNAHKTIVALGGLASTARGFDPFQDISLALPLSPYYRLNVEVGSCRGCANDPVPFIRRQRAAIASIQLKDGPATGELMGRASVRDVLQLLSREQYHVRTFIECAHETRGATAEEVKRCLSAVTQALS